jgi:hypothetical protein
MKSTAASTIHLRSGGFLRDAFQPIVVALPPRFVRRRQIVVIRLQASSSIDEFADNVGMASVPVRLSDHVRQHPQQRHFALVTPPRHMADRIERQGTDSFVCVRMHGDKN